MRVVLVTVLSVLYPFLIYFGRDQFGPRWLILLPIGLLLARGTKAWRERSHQVMALAVALIAVAVWVLDAHWPLKLYPVLISLGLLGVFGFSLLHPPTVVERMARLKEPNLSPAGVRYTRRVTQVWCGFFIINAVLCFVLAAFAPDRIWAIYTGAIAYVLMGILFAGEWLLRARFKAHYEAQ